jgi:hypothetical protein
VSEEENRHRSEVREWLRRGIDKDKTWLNELVKGIAKVRGKPSAERLWRDLKEQWQRGNRGEAGDWRD